MTEDASTAESKAEAAKFRKWSKKNAVLSISPVPRLALNLVEAAASIDKTPQTVLNLISRGKLRKCESIRHITIPVRELERFLAEDCKAS